MVGFWYAEMVVYIMCWAGLGWAGLMDCFSLAFTVRVTYLQLPPILTYVYEYCQHYPSIAPLEIPFV